MKYRNESRIAGKALGVIVRVRVSECLKRDSIRQWIGMSLCRKNRGEAKNGRIRAVLLGMCACV